MEAEDAHTQKIIGVIVSMSDMVDYVFNVKQFVTVAKLKEAIEEANDLMRKAVDIFNKHKDRGTLGEPWMFIDSISLPTNQHNFFNMPNQGGLSPQFRHMTKENLRKLKPTLPDSRTSLIVDCPCKPRLFLAILKRKSRPSVRVCTDFLVEKKMLTSIFLFSSRQ